MLICTKRYVEVPNLCHCRISNRGPAKLYQVIFHVSSCRCWVTIPEPRAEFCFESKQRLALITEFRFSVSVDSCEWVNLGTADFRSLNHNVGTLSFAILWILNFFPGHVL